MKNKLFCILMLVALSAGCSKSAPAFDCSALTKKLSDAALAYIAAPTSSQTCKAYVAALNDFVNNASKCGVITAADIADAKQEIASITCP